MEAAGDKGAVLLQCALAGARHRSTAAQSLTLQLVTLAANKQPAHLALVRDPSNTADANAIQVGGTGWLFL
jgi:hypothetical protein